MACHLMMLSLRLATQNKIGHGFGLPHTDENFNNADLGNCLDYTNRPSNNLRPGEYNCNRLKTMYGTVNGGQRDRFLRNAVQDEEESLPLREVGSVTDTMLADKYDQAMSELPHAIILANVKNSNHRTLFGSNIEPVENEWRVLRNHPRGGAFIRMLSDDLALEVHAVYPFN
jgi:hypothetical protein